MDKASFLLEIGCEELPAHAATRLADALASQLAAALKKSSLAFDTCTPLSTPRRLALKITGLQTEQADVTLERRGPAVKAAFDKDGNPTPAAKGFASSCGTTVDKLERLSTDKGEWLYANVHQAGQHIRDLLPGLLTNIIKQLPIVKPMRWGRSGCSFARPVHWLVMLLDDNCLDANLFGLPADRITYGHRFHHPEAISLSHANDYETALESARVIVDPARRQQEITQQIQAITEKNESVLLDEGLLAEVVQLVEWPVAVRVPFDEKFLQLPREALISAMKGHQKCFAIESKGALRPAFITVANIESQQPDAVVIGNQRVMQARLADAVFFFEADKKTTLSSMANALQHILFQKKLGTVTDKVQRISAVATELAPFFNVNAADVQQAAHLCKADLASDMVGEFPELQGIMGDYYARDANLPEAIATAIREHVQPRFSQDTPAQTALGQVLAIADRLDTLVGIFAIGKQPTGEKDPFALRRAAIGVLNTLLAHEQSLDLADVLNIAIAQLPSALQRDGLQAELLAFFADRQKALLQEQGIDSKIIQAVLATQPTDPIDIQARVMALHVFAKDPAAESLAAAHKRVNNLLAKQTAQTDTSVDPAHLKEDAEKALAAAIKKQQLAIAPLLEKRDYACLLACLASLRPAVDDFFEHVMVLVDDTALKQNRLNLLAQLQQLCWHVADLGRLG
ncbi:MAG: glycine--tRNA ligase beta subunit [marine bacterium B5-7]|nr:MAG: glycine--tRNA ligase beta subunit [marine bacterium B5-7]